MAVFKKTLLYRYGCIQEKRSALLYYLNRRGMLISSAAYTYITLLNHTASPKDSTLAANPRMEEPLSAL